MTRIFFATLFCVALTGCANDSIERVVLDELTVLPLFSMNDLNYEGAFKYDTKEYGDSRMSYARGVMEQSGNRLFVAGSQALSPAIAEFAIPELSTSTNIAELPSTGAPVQEFSRIFNRAQTGNPQGLNMITGMELHDGKLMVNATEWYDGSANNTHTTVVISDANDLKNSPVNGMLELPDGARSAGWIEDIPDEWSTILNADHITGFSSATSIIARNSVGPSAYAFQIDNILSASASAPVLDADTLMSFSLNEPLHPDLRNDNGGNDLWTISTGTWFATIIPNTRTYAAFGYLEGKDTYVGYKIEQDNGKVCGGNCAPVLSDNHNYYWLFDMEDLVAAQRGQISPSQIRPYDYGEFDLPFQREIGVNRINGGSFDSENGLIYLSLRDANRDGHRISPVTIVYSVGI